MVFPKLKKIRRYADMQNRFGGYDHTEGTANGDFYDMENLTSDNFPLLSVRPARAGWLGAVYDDDGKLTGFEGRMFLTGLSAAVNAGDKLCYCSFSTVYINGKAVMNCDLDTSVKVRSIVPFGRDLFIAPDGILIKDKGNGDFEIQTSEDIPRLDFAVEHNNRIWGCRCGENENGEFVNEIYACALGDPLTWRKYDGVSTDSYCANLGCAGAFTGAAVLGNDILFFKENNIIRISGMTPSDFTVTSFPARGVEKGAHRSIVNLNEKIFYKSRNGINVYDGALPYCISDELGNEVFTDAAAGAVKGKYYIAMTNGKNERKIYVFDTHKGLWHKENDSNTEAFVTVKNCLFSFNRESRFGLPSNPFYVYSLYLHDSNALPVPYNVFTGMETEPVQYEKEKNINWFAVTGRLGAAENETRVLRRIILRVKTAENSTLKVYAFCNDSENGLLLYSGDGENDGTLNIPVDLPRCDYFRLKLEGSGDFTLFSAAYIYERTGEVNRLG